jgi:lipopolysaccharide/colanic/teichoic acid biosynthesis glycosyltransferase
VSTDRPTFLRLLWSGIEPITLGIGAIGSVAAGLGLAFTVGITIGLAGYVAGVVGFVVIYCIGVVMQERRRAAWRDHGLVFHGATVDADPIKDFFVTPAYQRAQHPHLPPYVRRGVTDDVLSALDEERFVIVTGKRRNGSSRFVYEVGRECGRNTMVSGRMSVASEDPVMLLMRDSGGFATDETQVLFLRDFASRVIAGTLTTAFVRAWLDCHPGSSIITILNDSDADRIRANGTEAEDELEGLQGLASVVRLAPTLHGPELIEAGEQFPELANEQREWLPSYLVSADPLRMKFKDDDGDGHRLGRAIVRAVADWQRTGARRPASERYIREVVSRYFDGTVDGRFDAELSWAVEPVERFVGMLYPVEHGGGEVGYEVDDVILAMLDDLEKDDESVVLPDFAWKTVVDALTDDVETGIAGERVVEDLIGMGEAAMARGRRAVAEHVLRKAARFGSGHQHQRIVQILSAGTGFGTPSQSLVNSRRGDSVIQRLRAVEDLAQARKDHGKPPRGGDSALPKAFFAWIYRRRAMRTLVRFATLSLSDALSACIGLAIGLVLRDLVAGDFDLAVLTAAFTKSIALWSAIAIFASALVKLYRQDAQRARLGAIVLAMGAMGGLGFVATLADGFDLLAAAVAAFGGAMSAAFIDYRLRVKYDNVSRAWVKDHGLQSRALIIGSKKQAAVIERVLPNHSRPTVVVGFLTLDGDRSSPHCLGSVEDLERVALAHRVGRVLIADPEISPVRRQRLADRCHLRGLLVDAVASHPDIRAGSDSFVLGESLVVVRLLPLWQGDPGFFVKRALDLALALATIVVLFPILAVLAAISWWTSGRMVIRSWRPGLGGSVFGMYRFSTTPKDAASPGDPSDPDGDPARGTTGFGAWMRRRGFDELPQLFNILLGQMSFVGPRPLQVEDHSQLDDEQLLRYVVRPGVTSPWQLCSPPILTHAELVNLDIAYLRHWSILYDLEILVKTSRLMIRGRKTLPRLMQEDDRGAMYLTNSQKYDSTETTLPPRSQARGQRRWWHFMRR